MMRVRAGVLGLAVFLAAAVPPAAQAGAPTKYSSDDRGRLVSVTAELGTTKYKYFDSGSIAEMVDPGGWRYSFTQGDAPATLASAAPNFLPSLATAVSSPLDQSANRFLFTGFMYERELGLYLTPSGRLCDPSSGRFIQQDSHLGTVSEPPSLHRYFYGNANPLRYVDPTGHETATAGCYWGPSSCGPQNVPLTGVEKRAFAGLLGTLSWAGKAALETVNLALGRHWEGFGESFLKAADHPIDAATEAKGRYETHVNTSLDRAQERLEKGDDFGAAFGFTEQVTAPTAAAVVGAGDLAVGAVRTGTRLLARAPAVEVPPPSTPQLRPLGLSVESSTHAGKGFVVTEDGLMPSIGVGSQGADAFSYANSELRVGKWIGKEVRGRTVFQRNDIFDPVAVDDAGLTNVQRMGVGRPPIAYDGKPVNLHHLTQMEPGSLAEISSGMHSEFSKQLHGLVEPRKSFRYSPEGGTTAAEKGFKQYSRKYWQERAKEFQAKSPEQ